MKIVSILALAILVFLAVSSGIAKVLLVEREVDFFGSYGITKPFLMAFGFAQIVGGALLLPRKTRWIGAAIVAVTFLASLYLLIMDGNLLFSVITLVSTALLAVIGKQSLQPIP